MPTYTWITPKVNWIDADYYNGTDINRVENNIGYVRQMLIALDYTVPVLTINNSRLYNSVDYVSSINRIESNLDALRLSFVTPAEWQPIVTWSFAKKMTPADANRWELSAKQLYDLATVVPQSFRFSGTFFPGEEVLPQI